MNGVYCGFAPWKGHATSHKLTNCRFKLFLQCSTNCVYFEVRSSVFVLCVYVWVCVCVFGSVFAFALTRSCGLVCVFEARSFALPQIKRNQQIK